MDMITLHFGSKIGQQGEIPSANIHASARALAKLGAFMANKGTFEDTQLISTEVWEEMHSEPVMRPQMSIGRGDVRNLFTKGGFGKFDAECMEGVPTIHEHQIYENRLGFYGWMGLGGSVF